MLRDYHDEEDVPVAEMSTSDIENCLQQGFELTSTVTADEVTERLRLELFIRQNNLRG